MTKTAIKILPASAVQLSKNTLGKIFIHRYFCKFPLVCACQKLWKSLDICQSEVPFLRQCISGVCGLMTLKRIKDMGKQFRC